MPSSRGSCLPRDPTRISYVFCIGMQITTSATWERRWMLWVNVKDKSAYPQGVYKISYLEVKVNIWENGILIIG